MRASGALALRGRFPYNKRAVLSDGGRTGRPRKEIIAPRAFAYRVECPEEGIHCLIGHTYDRSLTSRGAGTFDPIDDGAQSFTATITPQNPSSQLSAKHPCGLCTVPAIILPVLLQLRKPRCETALKQTADVFSFTAKNGSDQTSAQSGGADGALDGYAFGFNAMDHRVGLLASLKAVILQVLRRGQAIRFPGMARQMTDKKGSLAFCSRCQRSATWTASGSASEMAPAYPPLRFLASISICGC